jgi:hypothetical protein
MTLFEDLVLEVSNLTPVHGLSPADFLNMPDIIGHTLGMMIHNRGMSLKDFATEVGVNETEALQLVEILVAKGYLIEEEQQEKSSPFFRVFFARMRTHKLPLDL